MNVLDKVKEQITKSKETLFHAQYRILKVVFMQNIAFRKKVPPDFRV